DRVLVTALTKRLCEDLTNYLDQHGFRVRYLHSEIETLERVEIITDLRAGEFDVLVGVNLLREGLDMPEVSLVCILDADKEGYLRSATSLIQQMGRAARNERAKVILYADTMTKSMTEAIEETERRRAKQLAYNEEHGVTPKTIRKDIRRGIESELKARRQARDAAETNEPAIDARDLVKQFEAEMLEAAEDLQFERAASLRDQMVKVKELIEAEETARAAEDEETGGPVMVRRGEIEQLFGGKKRKGRRRQNTGKPGAPGTKPGKRARSKG
ncbi:MAG: helicase-related protein, partial [Planctomycetota bacterium]